MKILLAANSYGLKAPDLGIPSGTTSLVGGVTNAIQAIMILLGALAVIMIIVGGIQMLISTGNPARIAKSRDTVLYSIVGLIVAISAWGIVTFIATWLGK